MPICAIYARVSDEMQAKGESVAHQVSFLREFARRKAQQGDEVWETPDDYIFCDEGITGTSMIKRPAVTLLLQQAREKKFAVVLFKGISRFARDTVDALVMLRMLQAFGLRVISFEENYDSDKESAELIFTMHSAVAQYESEKIGIRVRLGNFEKARAGKWSGRVPDGYILDENSKRLVPNPDRANVIQWIFDLAAQHKSGYRIAQLLNEEGRLTAEKRHWTAQKIQRVLQNPVYTGDVVYGRRVRKLAPPLIEDPFLRRYQVIWNDDEDTVATSIDAHPGIVCRDVFAAVQHAHGKNEGSHRLGKPRMLNGRLFCSCGSVMRPKSSGAGVLYYRCPRSHRADSDCQQPYLRIDAVEKAVTNALLRDLRMAMDHSINKMEVVTLLTAIEALRREEISHSPEGIELIRLLIQKVWIDDVNKPYELFVSYYWRTS